MRRELELRAHCPRTAWARAQQDAAHLHHFDLSLALRKLRDDDGEEEVEEYECTEHLEEHIVDPRGRIVDILCDVPGGQLRVRGMTARWATGSHKEAGRRYTQSRTRHTKQDVVTTSGARTSNCEEEEMPSVRALARTTTKENARSRD